MATMRRSLSRAFAYNVIGIPVTAGVLSPAFGMLLSPTLASAAMDPGIKIAQQAQQVYEELLELIYRHFR